MQHMLLLINDIAQAIEEYPVSHKQYFISL